MMLFQVAEARMLYASFVGPVSRERLLSRKELSSEELMAETSVACGSERVFVRSVSGGQVQSEGRRTL